MADLPVSAGDCPRQMADALRTAATPGTVATISEPATTGTTPTSAPLLAIRNVAKSFGKNPVLRDISLEVAEGEFLTILGESGSAKRPCCASLPASRAASSGEISMGGERLDDLPPYRRRVNTVFQHYALFPHLTVAENVGYGLRVAKRAPGRKSRLGSNRRWRW